MGKIICLYIHRQTCMVWHTIKLCAQVSVNWLLNFGISNFFQHIILPRFTQSCGPVTWSCCCKYWLCIQWCGMLFTRLELVKESRVMCFVFFFSTTGSIYVLVGSLCSDVCNITSRPQHVSLSLCFPKPWSVTSHVGLLGYWDYWWKKYLACWSVWLDSL